MVKFRTYGSYIFAIALFALTLQAEWSVNSSIGRSKIGLEDNLVLTLAVTGNKLDNLSSPRFDQDDNWALTNTSSSTSSNFQLINGKMSQSRTVTTYLYLAPKQKGTLTVPKISVSANGETKFSREFQVEVVEGSIGGQNSRQNAYSQPRSAPSPTPSSADIGDKLFLSVHVDKNEAYVGEQINVTFTLYTQYNLGELSMSKDAVFNGFWARELYRAKRLDYERKTIDGQLYNAVVLAKQAIFGLSSGEKTIEPMELECSVLTRRDLWGFFSHGDKVEVVGKPKKVTIKPLPSGSPSDFEGLVGDFSVTTEVSTDRPKTNEAFSYTFTVSGTGNIHILDQPEIEFPAGFDLFDVQESQNISEHGGKVSGTRKFEYILVPRSEGEFVFPAKIVRYFHPGHKAYEASNSKPINLIVEKGREEEGSAIQLVNRGEVMRVGEDIRFIAQDCNKLDSSRLSDNYMTTLYYLLPIEAILILLGFSISKKRNRLAEDIGYARYTRAMKHAMNELKKASGQIENSELFIAKVQNSILHYLGDRLSLPEEGLVFSHIRDRLAERRVDDVTLDAIEDLLEKLNFLRFAPGEKIDVSREFLDSARELIKKVDRVFK